MAEIVFATAAGRIALPVAELHDGDASLLDAVRHAGLPLGQSCRGEGVCRSCAVDILAGADHLGPLSSLERRFAARAADPEAAFHATRRLACQAVLPSADVAVSVVVAHPAWGRPPAADPPASAPETDATLEP